MHEIFIFLHLSITKIHKTQYSQHFRMSSTNLPRYSKFSITPNFRRKCEAQLCVVAKVKFSVVFVTVRFRIVLSVFGKKAESNFAFSAKARSETNRCWRKRLVKLCAFGSIQRIQTKGGIMRFRQICGVKRSVFTKNAE